jgi:nicotinamide-nucleotide amidase
MDEDNYDLWSTLKELNLLDTRHTHNRERYQRSFEAASMRAPIIEIIVIGNEILIGKTLDTNSHWLAKRLNKLGAELRQVTTVRDRHLEISRAVASAISRRPDFLLSVGGLGPTHDDITLSSLGRLLGKPLVLNREALDLVREKYVERFGAKVKLTSSRVKMARFPAGATPLPNPIGTAPAPCLRIGRVTLIALPGVPREMRAIFSGSVGPILVSFGGTRRFYERSLEILGMPESILSPIIDDVMKRNRRVYIKSHPQGIERAGRSHIELHFQVVASSERLAKAQLQQAVEMAKERLRGKAIIHEMNRS